MNLSSSLQCHVAGQTLFTLINPCLKNDRSVTLCLDKTLAKRQRRQIWRSCACMGEIMDIAVHFPLFFYLSFHLLIFLPEQPVTVMSRHRGAADSTRSIRQKAADSPDNGRQLIVSPLCLGLQSKWR